MSVRDAEGHPLDRFVPANGRFDFDRVVAWRKARERQVDGVFSSGGRPSDVDRMYHVTDAVEELRGDDRRLTGRSMRAEAGSTGARSG